MKSAIAALLAASSLLASPLLAQEKVDAATLDRIKNEEMNHSQVMDIMSWLSDVYGPRLTWSPNATRAKDWAMKEMTSWGLSNVHTEKWDTPKGLGWENEKFSLNAIAPMPFIVEAVPQAWSAGTLAPVTGKAMLLEAGCLDEAKAKYTGKLRNAFILATPPRNVAVTNFNPIATRITDSALSAMAAIKPGAPTGRGGGGRGAGATPPPPPSEICVKQFTRDSIRAATLAAAAGRAGRGGRAGGAGGAGRGGGRGGLSVADTSTLRWMKTQGVAAILLADASHTGGDIGTNNGASRDLAVAHVPTVHVAQESYGRIGRMLEKKVPVTLQMNMVNKFFPANTSSFNIIGEIPGTDPQLKDEVVMIGAHFDSWHSGTGATDNGAGSGVMLEAMRLLKTLNLQPRRTIRIGLWTGEEQGLLGSRAYVAEHFGKRDSTGKLIPTAEQGNFDVYFNVDNGSGKIRGIYIEGIEAERPIFSSWFKAFGDPGTQTVTILPTTGTDHQSFVTAQSGVGLPGFQFIQDGLDYGNFTHHTNQDVWERLQPEDMKFNSAIVASFAWLASQRDEKMPRPPMPMGRGAVP